MRRTTRDGYSVRRKNPETNKYMYVVPCGDGCTYVTRNSSSAMAIFDCSHAVEMTRKLRDLGVYGWGLHKEDLSENMIMSKSMAESRKLERKAVKYRNCQKCGRDTLFNKYCERDVVKFITARKHVRRNIGRCTKSSANTLKWRQNHHPWDLFRFKKEAWSPPLIKCTTMFKITASTGSRFCNM